MADGVQIPVVVDIDQAFRDAADRVSAAIKPLQREIDENTLNIKLKIGTEDGKDVSVTLKSLLTDLKRNNKYNVFTGPAHDLQELNTALEDAERRLSNLYAVRDKGESLSKGQKETVLELEQAISLIMAEIEQRQHGVNLIKQQTQNVIAATRAEEEREFIISKEAKTIADMSARLSALREKMNQTVPGSAEWKSVVKEIQKATEAMAEFEQKFTKATTKSGSINRMTSEMQALERQWDAMSKIQKFDKDGNLSKSAQKVINDYRKLSAEAETFGKRLTDYANKATRATNQLGNSLKQVGAAFGLYLSAHSLVRFAKQIRDVTGELEYQRVALGHLLQDTARGNALFEQIKEAAIESPFRIKDLVTYTKQLAAYRIEQENLFDTTKRLADISAGLGVDMNRLILAYGQVRAASVLRGQELRQFTEAGIPLVELLAEKFTDLKGEMVSTADVFKLISERAVPFSAIADIFEDLTSKGGMFYKMQEEQAKTLKGRWEKLKDAYDIALQSIGETNTFQTFNDTIIGGLRLLADNLRVIIKLVDAGAWAWGAYNAAILLTAKRTAAVVTAEQAAAIAEAMRTRNVSGLIVKILGQAAAEKALAAATTQAIAGTNALARAFGKLKVALLTNPYLFAGAAIVGIIATLTQFKKAANDAQSAVTALNRAVDDMHTENKRHERVTELIKQYKELSEVTERNAAQNETLARTTKKLSAEFPELRDRMNDANISLKDRLELVEKMNEEEAKRLKNIIKEKETELTTRSNELSYAEEERDKLNQQVQKVRELYNTANDAYRMMEESGKKSRGGFFKFLFGGNAFDQAWNALTRTRADLDKIESQYNEKAQAVDDLTTAIENLKKELYGVTEDQADASLAWKDQLKKLQNTASGIQLFTPQQLDGWHRLFDVSKDLEKEWKKLRTEVEALDAGWQKAVKSGDKNAADWKKDLDLSTERLKGLELIRDFFHFVWGKQTSTRDTRLSQLKSDISELTNAYKKSLDLQKYMSKETALKEIDKLFPQLAGWEPTLDNVIAKLQSKLEDVKKQLAKSPKSKTLLDMQRALETEISNLQVDNLKDQLEKKIKQISDELKRSETARKFWQDILDLTGDQQLATNLSMDVYGTVGDEFKDRIGKELYQALHEFDKLKPGEIDPELLAILDGDLTIFDFKDIKKHLGELPEEVRKVFEEAISENEKFNAEWYKNFVSTFNKAKSFQDRINILENQRTQKLLEASQRNLSKKDMTAITKYYDKEIAKVQLEALKDTYEWTKAFEDLQGVSDMTLRNLISLIDEYVKLNRQNLGPQQLKELTKAREQAEAQLIQRHSIEGLTTALKKYEEASERRNYLEKTGFIFSKKYKEATDDQKKAIKELSDAYAALIAELETYITSVKDLMSTFASDDDASYWSSQLDNLTKTLGGVGKFAVGLASIAAGNANPQTIAATISGLADMVSGIFGGVKAKQIRDANKVIDAQDEKLKALTKSYDKLGDAMAKSFGSDYIYNFNEQLDILLAKQKAYEEQAAAEEGKGKKADKKKVEEYRQSAEEASKEIENMKGKLAEFFTGTDVTSAAKDFASAWIEAYKEFGSTTDAMKEKFQDLVQSMVEQSLAAKIMQGFLQPIFDEIDAMAKDGALDAAEIATVSKMATSVIPQINDAMTNLMTQLSAAGYNMRQEAGKFTGISRDIASASEESILGLAAGINTQNSYMYSINENVKQILALMNGGTTPAVTQTATAEEGGARVWTVQERVNEHLPNIDQNIASILNALNRVIIPVGSQYYVSVRM